MHIVGGVWVMDDSILSDIRERVARLEQDVSWLKDANAEVTNSLKEIKEKLNHLSGEYKSLMAYKKIAYITITISVIAVLTASFRLLLSIAGII